MKRMRFVRFVAVTGVAVIVLGVVLGYGISVAFAGAGGGHEEAAAAKAPAADEGLKSTADKYFPLAIAAVISLSCLAAGYAVGKVGSAAMGAASEKPEVIGRALLFVALAEGIAIYGVLGAILLYTKMGG
jgi:V/A-type H+-transporting ATPase subunit K